MLGDAARLAGRDVRLADRVQEGGLAVVDVAQDADDRRARREQQGLVLVGLSSSPSPSGPSPCWAVASPRCLTSRTKPYFSATFWATASSIVEFIEAKPTSWFSSEMSLNGLRLRAVAKSRTMIGGLRWRVLDVALDGDERGGRRQRRGPASAAGARRRERPAGARTGRAADRRAPRPDGERPSGRAGPGREPAPSAGRPCQSGGPAAGACRTTSGRPDGTTTDAGPSERAGAPGGARRAPAES